LDDLFDAHFNVGHKRFTYRLGQDHSAALYQRIGHFISTGEGTDGIDVTFRETGLRGEELSQTFRIDTTDAFTLYRRLGTHLQKHYPGNESRLHLHEANS
jgi:hypothetical protein